MLNMGKKPKPDSADSDEITTTAPDASTEGVPKPSKPVKAEKALPVSASAPVPESAPVPTPASAPAPTPVPALSIPTTVQSSESAESKEVNLLKYKIEVLLSMLAIKDQELSSANDKVDALKWVVANRQDSSTTPASVSSQSLDINEFRVELITAMNKMTKEFPSCKTQLFAAMSQESEALPAILPKEVFVKAVSNTCKSLSEKEINLLALRWAEIGCSSVCVTEFLQFFNLSTQQRHAKHAHAMLRMSGALLPGKTVVPSTNDAPVSSLISKQSTKTEKIQAVSKASEPIVSTQSAEPITAASKLAPKPIVKPIVVLPDMSAPKEPMPIEKPTKPEPEPEPVKPVVINGQEVEPVRDLSGTLPVGSAVPPAKPDKKSILAAAAQQVEQEEPKDATIPSISSDEKHSDFDDFDEEEEEEDEFTKKMFAAAARQVAQKTPEKPSSPAAATVSSPGVLNFSTTSVEEFEDFSSPPPSPVKTVQSKPHENALKSSAPMASKDEQAIAEEFKVNVMPKPAKPAPASTPQKSYSDVGVFDFDDEAFDDD